MNPELRRNLWLELTPRRVTTMTVFLVLIFFASTLSGNLLTPAGVAYDLYYFIVIVWGTWNAALSVVGEIRERTWDFQRLSALSAGEMTWGKLFGATALNWYGGVICLGVLFVYRATHEAFIPAIFGVLHLLVIGLFAQSTAFLASLLATMRRQSHTRLEVFFYWLAGIIAASVARDLGLGRAADLGRLV